MSKLQEYFQEKFALLYKSVFTKDDLTIEQGIVGFRYLPKNESEYEVILEVYEDAFMLFCGGWHDYVQKDESDSDEEFSDFIIDKLRIIFSGRTTLKIYYAGKTPYRWELLSEKPEDKISSLNVTLLFFYNYFARKTAAEKRINLI